MDIGGIILADLIKNLNVAGVSIATLGENVRYIGMQILIGVLIVEPPRLITFMGMLAVIHVAHQGTSRSLQVRNEPV